ncbi:D-lyxose ketol-isomerase [Glaciimonas immobilis]|uniref:D-lyxose ketol-isomerase n=1 Tax=Glaciimonas immobilis TaxID=728004 RepID=A0A840RVV0_9BURK|nr:D-lyxose ketol-isomerase [Glaciimonas immobilis]
MSDINKFFDWLRSEAEATSGALFMEIWHMRTQADQRRDFGRTQILAAQSKFRVSANGRLTDLRPTDSMTLLPKQFCSAR